MQAINIYVTKKYVIELSEEEIIAIANLIPEHEKGVLNHIKNNFNYFLCAASKLE